MLWAPWGLSQLDPVPLFIFNCDTLHQIDGVPAGTVLCNKILKFNLTECWDSKGHLCFLHTGAVNIKAVSDVWQEGFLIM